MADGRALVRVETDGSPAAAAAADLVRSYAVRMTGVALPAAGPARALRFERDLVSGYRIELDEGGARIHGDDPVRAAYDLLEGWGCRIRPGAEPEIAAADRLELEARRWDRKREAWIEADRFDPAWPASGVAVRGLGNYHPERFREARRLGYRVRVASVTFDDFLPPALFAEHPDWFALRAGRREARGNFALLDPLARAAWLDRLGKWLESNPEADVVGIWPEVTAVWDERALAHGAREAYALLWRAAAARFSDRRFEILATGLTLEPPAGAVPANVEVRLRPGRRASALQGVAGQELERIVEAWERAGAKVVLEIDAAPESFCGMPWPCHEAIRADARRFSAAVLRHAGYEHARLWRFPETPPRVDARMRELLDRARHVRSWGHPADAADLFIGPGRGIGYRIGAIERLHRIAADERGDAEERRTAAADVFLGYRAILRDLAGPAARSYRRAMARPYRRMLETLVPGGVKHEVGPARVCDSFDRMQIETDRLRLGIDRATATVDSLHVKLGREWGPELAGQEGVFFAVVALAGEVRRTAGEVDVSSPEPGVVRATLGGRLRPDGPRWSSTLTWAGHAAIVRQHARLDTGVDGIAVGSRWKAGPLDRWVCPPYATEGRLDGKQATRVSFGMAPGTLLYCRAGERGAGLALRPRGRARVSLTAGAGADAATLVAVARGREIECDWIVFQRTGELGR